VNHVEGYTTADPVADADWDDVVRWDVNRNWFDHQEHNLDGFICHEAASEACRALGHVISGEEWFDSSELHPCGWDGELICPATRTGAACTTCESDDCDTEWTPTDTNAFWALFSTPPATGQGSDR